MYLGASAWITRSAIMGIALRHGRVTKIIVIANQKGGVGKTTTCVNLAASLAAANRRVLLIDLDPQGNATMGCGIDKNQLHYSVNDLLMQQAKLAQIVVKSPAKFNVAPANSDLTEAEVWLLKKADGEYHVRSMLTDEAVELYDFVLIDCPPSLNMLTINALVAAHSVLIPVQCEYYALEGLASLLQTIKQLQATVNPGLQMEGLLRTMYDRRNSLAREVSKNLLSHFNDKVYQTVIPRNIRLAEAPSHGMPALWYDKRSQGAMAYLMLAGELLRRQDKPVAGKMMNKR